MGVELLKKSVFRSWERYAELCSHIRLHLVEELRHLLGIQLLCLTDNRYHLIMPGDLSAQVLPTIIVVHILLRCPSLPLDTGKPHPHQSILADGAFLRCLLDLDGIGAVLQEGKDVGQLLVEDQPPCLLA